MYIYILVCSDGNSIFIRLACFLSTFERCRIETVLDSYRYFTFIIIFLSKYRENVYLKM